MPSHFMGSPVAFGGFIAMTSEDGETFMLKAGPRHEIVRTNTVDEPVYSSPAIANGRIYIRGEKHLFAIGDALVRSFCNRFVSPNPVRDRDVTRLELRPERLDSEHRPHSQLKPPRTLRREDPAEGRRSEERVGQIVVDAVEQVERFGAELDGRRQSRSGGA